MSRDKVGYPFLAFPAELHPLWETSSTHDLGLCYRLFKLTKGLPYQLHGKDWMGWLCRQMMIHGAERRNVRAALQRKHTEGLIRIEGDRIVVGFGPDFDVRSTSLEHPIDVPLTSLEHPSNRSRVVQLDSSIENHSTPKIQIDKIEEIKLEKSSDGPDQPVAIDRVIAGALRAVPSASSSDFRRPLPEPPPDAVLAPSAMAERLRLAERIERYGASQGRKAVGFSPSFHRSQSLKLAEWCLTVENQQDWKLGPVELAKAVCDGLFADEYARTRGCPLVLAVRNPQGFLAVLKPVAKAPPPPSRQEHAVWTPPPDRETEAVSPEEARELGMAALSSLLPRLKLAAGAAE